MEDGAELWDWSKGAERRSERAGTTECVRTGMEDPRIEDLSAATLKKTR